MFHMAEGMGHYWMLDSSQYSKLPTYVSPSKPDNGGSRSRSPGERLIEHEIVQIPNSPSRSGNCVQRLLRARVVWIIFFAMVLVIVLVCKVYEEKMRQLRIIDYTIRVNELKDSMKNLEHHVSAAQIKLREWKEHYRHLHPKSHSSSGAL